MTDYPQVQGYVSTHTPAFNYDIQPNWGTGQIMAYALTVQASVFDFKLGTEIHYANLTVAFPEAVTMDAAGNYIASMDLSNYTGLVQFSPSLVELYRWGAPRSTKPVFPDPPAIPLPSVMTTVYVGAQGYLMSVGLEHPVPLGPALSAVILGATFSLSDFTFNAAGQSSCICPGPSTSTTAIAYVVTGPYLPSITPQQLNIYAFTAAFDGTNSTFTAPLIGTVLPSAIDAQWTVISENGVIYDPTDGNIILEVGSSSPATNGAYIVKLKATDLTVIWKVPIPHMTPDSATMGKGRIKNGILNYFSWGVAPVAVYVINTKDGNFTTVTNGLNGIDTSGAQCSDDVAGCVLAYGTFNKQDGGPTPLNNTPDSFKGWYALYITQGGATTYTAIRMLPGRYV